MYFNAWATVAFILALVIGWCTVHDGYYRVDDAKCDVIKYWNKTTYEDIIEIQKNIRKAAKQGKYHVIVSCSTPEVYRKLDELGYTIDKVDDRTINISWFEGEDY